MFSRFNLRRKCARGSAKIEYVSMAAVLTLGLLVAIVGTNEAPGMQVSVEDSFIRAAYGNDAYGESTMMVRGREVPRPNWCPGGVSNWDGGTCGTLEALDQTAHGGGGGDKPLDVYGE